MTDLKNDEVNLTNLLKTSKVLKILWFIFLAISIATPIISIIAVLGSIGQAVAEPNPGKVLEEKVPLFFILNIIMTLIGSGIIIAIVVFQINAISKIGRINPTYQNVTRSSAKTLLVVGLVANAIIIFGNSLGLIPFIGIFFSIISGIAFFVGITTIVGAFTLGREVKMALAQLENEKGKII